MGKLMNQIIKRIKIEKYIKLDIWNILMKLKIIKKIITKRYFKKSLANEALNHRSFDKYGKRKLFCNFLPEKIKPYLENLFNYKYNSKLQELVIPFLVHNLTNSDETLIILKMFRYLNKKGDCKLTKLELKEIYLVIKIKQK